MLVSTAVFAASGFASPLNSALLPLVPPGAEIVAGFDNHPAGNARGPIQIEDPKALRENSRSAFSVFNN